jgi:hypothetical protein
MAATADVNAPLQEGELINRGMTASTKVYAGTLAAINAAGTALAGADTAGLKIMGFFTEQVDNSDGLASALNAEIDRRPRWVANSATNAVTVAEIGRFVYVEDDQTVNKDGGTNHIAAGLCLDLDSTLGVLVDPRLAPLAI